MDIDSLNIKWVKKLTGVGTGVTNMQIVKPDGLKAFLDEQETRKTRSMAFVDCQNDEENGKVKFTGCYQIPLTPGSGEDKVAFQPGGKGASKASALAALGLVVFYCQYGAQRSPSAMASYMKYLADNGKTQRVVLLEGGITTFAKLYPKNNKLERWVRPALQQTPKSML